MLSPTSNRPQKDRLEAEFRRLARLACRSAQVDVAAVYLWDGACTRVAEQWCRGPAAEATKEPLGELCRSVIDQGEPVSIEDARATPPLWLGAVAGRAGGLRAFAGVPIRWDDQTIGALCVAAQAPRAWCDDDLTDLGDLAALGATEMRLLHTIRDLAEASAVRQQRDDLLRLNEFQLGERIKEQRCLYTISAALRAPTPLETALQEVVEALPPGWRVPEHTFALLRIRDDVYVSGTFQTSPHRMSAPIFELDEHVGTIEVHVDPEGGRIDGSWFLPEERDLLDEIAANVGESLARRRAEEALARNEARFRALTEESTDVISTVDVSGRFLYVSPSVESALGRRPDELVGTAFADLVHPDDREAVLHAHERLLQAPNGTNRAQFRIQHADGSWRIAETRGRNLIDDPNVRGILVTTRDVTERVTAEERARFQAHLLEVVEQAVVATDVDGRITFWNRYAESLYGWSAEEALGEPAVTLFMPTDAKQWDNELIRNALAGGSIHTEATVRTRNGRELVTQCVLAPLRDEEGNVGGALVASTDVTERKKLEAVLVQAQRLESLGRLTGGVAHEFNNILTSIDGFSSLVLDRVDDPEVREDMAQIRSGAERASTLTNELLAFSRQQVLQPRVVDLTDTIRSLRTMVRPLVGEHVEIHTLLEPELRSVRVDPGQMEQVLINLIVNAREAMPAGGRVTIETCNVDLDEADAAQSRRRLSAGPHIVVRVIDNGPGMSPDILEHVFEPFFTTKPEGQNSGLGLSAAFGIVTQSGGTIDVDSTPGQGTAFCIYLPTVEREDRPSSGAKHGGKRAGGGTVLVAEDDPAVRRLVERVLSREGYRVLVACDGAEALQRLVDEDEHIDLLVSDVVMPRMGGREILERLAKMSPDTRVLLMSGYTDDEILRQGIRTDACEFIGKPFKPRELARRVRALLDQRVS